jgi:hypothetical protein
MKSLIIVAIAALAASALTAHAKDLNPTLQQIIASHGGCVPSGIISFKERNHLYAAGIEMKDCMKPSLLSDEKLTRDRTFEAEQIHHPPTVMTF